MSDLVLVGDIGGTNSRFAVTVRGTMVLRSERHYSNAGFPTLQSAIDTYLRDVEEKPGSGVLAIAGPVAGESVAPTNLPSWRFDRGSLRAALGFSCLDVINDFEAVAYALPHLSGDQAKPVGTPLTGALDGTLAVLGPGTGLGIGALVKHGAQWRAIASEGGHAEVGSPVSREGRAVHETIFRQLGRVSGEHVLSGSGLERIDAALRALAGQPLHLSAAEIGHRALTHEDPVATKAALIFFDYLARFAGDVALMFGAKGGVFLYGGVCQKLAPLLDPKSFRATFEDKSPLRPFLQEIPIKLITAPAPGLLGCAAVAVSWA